MYSTDHKKFNACSCITHEGGASAYKRSMQHLRVQYKCIRVSSSRRAHAHAHARPVHMRIVLFACNVNTCSTCNLCICTSNCSASTHMDFANTHGKLQVACDVYCTYKILNYSIYRSAASCGFTSITYDRFMSSQWTLWRNTRPITGSRTSTPRYSFILTNMTTIGSIILLHVQQLRLGW